MLGNVLGGLTASRDKPLVHARLVTELRALGECSGGNVRSLSGAQNCLFIYLDELNDVDIKALREEMLGSQEAKIAILDQISLQPHHPSRKQASQVLDQIANALDQR